jgi:mannose-6-phosphate isomerase-like protein (cupin superfamily)
MFRTRVSKRIFIAAALVVAVSAGLIWVRRTWATSSSGTMSTLVGRATFQPTMGDVLQVHREQPPNWGVVVQARPALDVAVQTITFQPGGQSGWHSHPGPVFISVVSGEMTFYMGDDPECKPTVRRAGEGFLDTGDHTHIARNESGQPATNVVTYFVPPGAPLRIDQPNPGNCPF